jgi:uncharacterized damage-inducible protein DinB
MTIGKPVPGDYAPYYQKYLDASASVENALDLLHRQNDNLIAMASWPEAKAGHRYAEGKWTVGQVLGHMADTERIFAYRLLRIARGDTTPLPGFDENAYQGPAGYDRRPLASIVAELSAVRAASLALVTSLDATALDRAGTASDQRVTARALVWLIAGHFAHHAGILRERYGI